MKKLLWYTSTQYKNINLSDKKIIILNHLLFGLTYLIKEFIRLGAKTENIFILGKNYSTNNEFMKKTKLLGCYVSSLSEKFENSKSYEKVFPMYVDNFLKEIQSNFRDDIKNTILIDDGGFLINSINENPFWAGKIMGAHELTSSGYQRIKDQHLHFPVVNIARSKIKLEVEAEFIAKLCIGKIIRKMSQYKVSKKKILIIGNGAIGGKVYQLLKTKYDVKIVDKEEEYMLNQFTTIIGATGSNPIGKEIFKTEEQKILISISSTDKEFPANLIRKKSGQKSNIHNDFIYKNIILVNGGFPINFTGGKYSLPKKQVSLTYCLILAGTLESVLMQSEIGVIGLPVKIQKNILKEFYKKPTYDK